MEKGQQWEMDLYERAVEVYGDKAQIIKAAEELSELSAALNKLTISLIWGIGDRTELEEKMREYARKNFLVETLFSLK